MEKKNDPNVIIHYVNNKRCEDCGQGRQDFFPGMCDAHTHGLNACGSLELQFVLDCYPPETIAWLLNGISRRICAGERFSDGDLIEGFTDDGASLRVFQTTDTEGKPILRIIVPDGDFRFPEESDEYPYCLQLMSPYRDAVQ